MAHISLREFDEKCDVVMWQHLHSGGTHAVNVEIDRKTFNELDDEFKAQAMTSIIYRVNIRFKIVDSPERILTIT